MERHNKRLERRAYFVFGWKFTVAELQAVSKHPLTTPAPRRKTVSLPPRSQSDVD